MRLGALSSVEDRLKRIEDLLRRVIEKIDYLENKLKSAGLYSEELRLASELVAIFSMPVTAALESAGRLFKILSSVQLDPISRDILKALSTCERLSISEITRRVRSIRGRASRRIVRERLVMLERMGLVANRGEESRPLYMLRRCIDAEG